MEEDFTTLISGASSHPVHWRKQPDLQDSFPFVNLTMVAAPTGYSLDGENGLQQTIVQVDVWGESYSSVVVAEREISAVLSGYNGITGSTHFDFIEKGTMRDLSTDLTQTTSKTMLHGRSVDYDIRFS